MLGMRLDYMPLDQFMGKFLQAAEASNSVYCCVPDVAQCMRCYDQSDHRNIVNNADFVMSDSVVLQRSRALRHGVKQLNTLLGADMMLAICKKAAEKGISVGLVGGRTEEVLRELADNLRLKFPDLQIAFSYAPSFRNLSPGEEAEMLAGLEQSGAKIVFFGLGCPKQEQWMARYRGKIMAAMIGVGAAFDTNSGAVKSSPKFVHRLGFEWLFRLVREPRRLFRRYFGTAPRFILLIVMEWVNSKTKRGSPAVQD
jgi:N-acetylglucosaminyldiphosphoundecaprenol N-acetyl-beta-D-mannosaminyltransferase